MKRHRMTAKLEFSQKTREEIRNRDGGCFFCMRGYHMEASDTFGYTLPQIMHIVPRSSLGMGVKENGVLGCQYHHNMMDNGNKGLRGEMIGMLEEYMRGLYPGWSRSDVIYQKYSFGKEKT